LAENPGSNTHPKVAEVASPLLSSISDAKSKPAPKSKIARKCTAFLRLQTPNSPTRFREDPEFVAQGISRDEIANRLRVIILPNGSGAPHGQCQDCARGRTEESIAAGSLRGACGQVRDNDATPRQRATH